MNKNRLNFIYISCILIMFFASKVSANEFLRTCKYYNPDTKENVFVKWKNAVTKPALYDSSGKYIGHFTLANTIEDAFIEGCRNRLYYSKPTFLMPEPSVMWSNVDKTGDEHFVFGGIVSEGEDIFYSGSYEESKNNPSKNEFIDHKITCSYNLKNGFKVQLKVDNGGGITVITKNKKDKSVKTVLNNPEEVFKSLNEFKKCPPTVCYNKNSLGRKDRIEFNSDINYDCPSSNAFGKTTNSELDRKKVEENKLQPFIPKEIREEGNKIKDKVKENLDSYIECLNFMDLGKKCEIFYSLMKTSCLTDVGSDLNLICSAEKKRYVDCIKEKYTGEEISNKCGMQESMYERAYDELEDYGERSGDQSVRFYGVQDYDPDFGVDYDLEDLDCDVILGEELLKWLSSAYFLIQVFAVIVTVVTGMMDITKAVASSEEDSLKKAFKSIRTRLIVTAILIILPILIEFILGIVDIPGLTNKNPLCK